jgi:hypothetical protein
LGAHTLSGERSDERTFATICVQDVTALLSRCHERGERLDPPVELARGGEPRRTVERDILRADACLEGADPRVQEPECLDDVRHRVFDF